MRRRKQKLLKLLPTIIILAVIISIYMLFFHKRKNIDEADKSKNNNNYTVLQPKAAESKPIDLPTEIYTIDQDGNSQSTNETKTYKSSSSSKSYLVPVQTQNNITILIGSDSSELIKDGMAIELGGSYEIQGIPEKIKDNAFFQVSNYDFPILLLLTYEGKVYYVDVESAYYSGTFQVSGYIDNIPPIDVIHNAEIDENGEKYNTAILIDQEGKGYEFDLSMIGK